MDISIRHYELDDIPAIKTIYEQPSCYSGTLQLPYPSLRKSQQLHLNQGMNYHSLVAEVEGEIVGVIAMETHTNPRRSHVGVMAMAVSEAYQGKGIGSTLLEALIKLANNWLAIKRIELEVFTENDKAIELYKKHGFEIEGTAKGYAFRNGEYADAYRMAKT